MTAMNYSTMRTAGFCVLLAFSFGLLLGGSPSAHAADKKDKAARRNAVMMQQMKQQFEQEKANMQTQFDAEKKKLEDELKSSNENLAQKDKQLGVVENKLAKTTRDLKATEAEKAKLQVTLDQKTQTLEQTEKALADLKNEHNQALADLKFNDNQRKTLATNLANTTQSLNTCEDKNAQLYQTGKEVIQIYDSPSRYESVMREEKFFQLKRVELENILQGKLDKLDEAKINKSH